MKVDMRLKRLKSEEKRLCPTTIPEPGDNLSPLNQQSFGSAIHYGSVQRNYFPYYAEFIHSQSWPTSDYLKHSETSYTLLKTNQHIPIDRSLSIAIFLHLITTFCYLCFSGHELNKPLKDLNLHIMCTKTRLNSLRWSNRYRTGTRYFQHGILDGSALTWTVSVLLICSLLPSIEGRGSYLVVFFVNAPLPVMQLSSCPGSSFRTFALDSRGKHNTLQNPRHTWMGVERFKLFADLLGFRNRDGTSIWNDV